MSTFVTLKRFFDVIRSNSTKIVRNITVEPLLPLYIIANVLTAFAAQNLYLDKACRVNLEFSDEVCDALARRETNLFKNEEIEVQKIVARMNGWKMIIQTFIPCLMMLFVGSWSDRNRKRKPCMLIPVFGELISSASLALNVFYKDWPMEYAGLTEAFFEGITGGWVTMLMGAFSYVADITTEKQRTVRLGIANTCFSAGVPIAMSLSGILLKFIGFYGVFIISVFIHLIAFLYGLFFIKESQTELKPQTNCEKSFFADFFDPSNAIETFKIFTRKGLKLQILILLIVVMVVVGPMHGEQAVLYLYTRLKFNWNHIDFSVYSTYATLMTMGGTLIALGIFSHLVQMHDSIVGIIGSFSKIAASFVYAFAANSFVFYFGPVVEIFHYASFICMRSIASKMVEKEERGRLNSLVGVVEALAPTIYAPLYSRIYTSTIMTFPGAFFLVGGGLKIIAVVIFFFMYIQHLKKSSSSSKNPNPETFQEKTFDNPNYTIDHSVEKLNKMLE